MSNNVYSGTNNTLTFSCFESNEERTAAASAHPVNLWNASSTAPGTGWAEASLFASKCNTSEQTSSVGEFVGTVFTARDIMQIVDALDQGPLLNYYGTHIYHGIRTFELTFTCRHVLRLGFG